MGIDAGANGGPPLGKFCQPHQRVAQTPLSFVDLIAPASQFLTQADRHGIHEVGAAGGDDAVHFCGLGIEGFLQLVQSGQEILDNGEIGAQMNG